MNGFDLYFAARLAFLDRGDVRLRTYDHRATGAMVVEARSAAAVVSYRLDYYEMRTGPAWLAADVARELRAAFDRHERRVADRLAGTARVA